MKGLSKLGYTKTGGGAHRQLEALEHFFISSIRTSLFIEEAATWISDEMSTNTFIEPAIVSDESKESSHRYAFQQDFNWMNLLVSCVGSLSHHQNWKVDRVTLLLAWITYTSIFSTSYFSWIWGPTRSSRALYCVLYYERIWFHRSSKRKQTASFSTWYQSPIDRSLKHS